MNGRRKVLGALASMLLVVGLSGCAKPPGTLAQSEPHKPVVTKIAVLSVNSPDKLRSENRNPLSGIAYPGWLEAYHNWYNSKQITATMEAVRLGMGQKMTAALADALAKEGFQVELITGPKGPPDDPEDVDYKKFSTDAAILHIWFDTVGMYSGRTSSDYVPRVNVRTNLQYANGEDSLYDETLYYGADSRGEDYWSIPADSKYKFPDFAAMTDRVSEVAEGYDVAIQKIATHLAGELKKQFWQPEKAMPHDEAVAKSP